MPKTIRIGRDERPGKRFDAPAFVGAAPLTSRDHLRRLRDTVTQRGWLDLTLLFATALVLSAIIVAIGPEVARP